MYEATPAREARPAYLRDRVHALDGDLAVDCDVVVIGTGAGGAVVGKELAEAGLAVVMVEEGRYVDRSELTGRPFAMQQKLYRRGGSTFSVGNVPIPIPIGQSVGGTTTINSGTCYRTPDRVLAGWAGDLGLAELAPDQLAPYFDRVEQVLQVEAARASLLGGNGRVVARGADALGFTRHHPLRRNAPACDGQGVCCFGCPTDAKRSTNVSYVPLALRAGAELFTGARVHRIIVERGRAVGVVARGADGARLTVRGRAVVVACGTLITPVLLAGSGLAGGSGALGEHLTIHPCAGAIAELDEPVQPWRGIPQGYSVDELHDEGILFEGAMLPLEMTLTMSQLVGPELIRLAESFDRAATFGFLIEDDGHGRVRAVRGHPVIEYWCRPTPADRRSRCCSPSDWSRSGTRWIADCRAACSFLVTQPAVMLISPSARRVVRARDERRVGRIMAASMHEPRARESPRRACPRAGFAELVCPLTEPAAARPNERVGQHPRGLWRSRR